MTYTASRSLQTHVLLKTRLVVFIQHVRPGLHSECSSLPWPSVTANCQKHIRSRGRGGGQRCPGEEHLCTGTSSSEEADASNNYGLFRDLPSGSTHQAPPLRPRPSGSALGPCLLGSTYQAPPIRPPLGFASGSAHHAHPSGPASQAPPQVPPLLPAAVLSSLRTWVALADPPTAQAGGSLHVPPPPPTRQAAPRGGRPRPQPPEQG